MIPRGNQVSALRVKPCYPLLGSCNISAFGWFQCNEMKAHKTAVSAYFTGYIVEAPNLDRDPIGNLL